MSLNDITIGIGQLADWYGTQLVAEKKEIKPARAIKKPKFLGDFGRKILILVTVPQHAYVSDEDLKFLTGILTACKLSMADVGVINLHGHIPGSIPQLIEACSPSSCWLFGVEARELGPARSDQPLFTAPALAQLSGDAEAKRHLWGQLKNHYGS